MLNKQTQNHEFELMDDVIPGIHKYEKYQCKKCGYWIIWNTNFQQRLREDSYANMSCEDILIKIVMER